MNTTQVKWQTTATDKKIKLVSLWGSSNSNGEAVLHAQTDKGKPVYLPLDPDTLRWLKTFVNRIQDQS